MVTLWQIRGPWGIQVNKIVVVITAFPVRKGKLRETKKWQQGHVSRWHSRDWNSGLFLLV